MAFAGNSLFSSLDLPSNFPLSALCPWRLTSVHCISECVMPSSCIGQWETAGNLRSERKAKIAVFIPLASPI